MKFWVLNYLLAQEFEPTEPTLAIRIFDPGSTDETDKGGNNPARSLIDSPLWVAQLTYCFEDIDLTLYEHDSPETFERLRRSHRCFDSLMAKKMIEEVSKHLPVAKGVMVHCNAGLSRSVAVAAALCKRLQLQPEWSGRRTKGLMKPTYLGNKWVYHGLMDA